MDMATAIIRTGPGIIGMKITARADIGKGTGAIAATASPLRKAKAGTQVQHFRI
jgi:hypothetical protein